MLFPAGEVGVQLQPETTLVVAPLLFRNDYRGMIHFSWRVMELISEDSRWAEQVQVRGLCGERDTCHVVGGMVVIT